jgi:hypothetical protein
VSSIQRVVIGGAVLLLAAGGGVAAASSTLAPRATARATARAAARAGRPDRPLLAVSCSSAQACTAVGGLFAARFNGRGWSIEPIAVPSFSTAMLDFLAGVSCPTRSGCLAVGLEYPPVGADVNYDYLALAEGRHGSSWSDQSPALSLTRDGYLLAASCPRPGRCIAVGQNVTSALAMGWDGGSWTVQLAPVAPPVMSVLNGVSCTTPARCIAVGSLTANQFNLPHALAERWNGAAWSIVPTPRTTPFQMAGLNAVSCPGRSCTAVGAIGYHQLIEHWNGHKWSIQAPPRGAPDATLNGVSCLSRTDCVAVGALTDGSGNSIAEGWNGRRWSIEATPTLAGGSLLNGVSCVSRADCVAVGAHRHTPLVERWNGTTWSVQPTS